MKTYVAFFRGINVGGKNLLPMKDLIKRLESISLQNVRTYIQSGNAVFETDETRASTLSSRISSTIMASHGFEPRVLLLELEDVEKSVRANPFAEAERDPKSLHFFFLATTPGNPDIHALEAAKIDSERFILTDNVFYLHAPDGIGRSKLAANAETLLGVPATARNWRTVSNVLEMAKRDG
jgi:uncharacterized protein (DUF1697 family)